jgi:hypothetical protein
MTRKRAGWVLLVTGAICMFGYMLTSLRGVSPLLVRIGGMLFYVGIGVLLAGLLLRWPRRTHGQHKN